MDVTTRKSTNPDDYQDIPHPVAVLAKENPDAFTTTWHRHKRGQLIYASSGVVVVTTQQGSWVIPPQRAVWVPSGVEHKTHTVGRVAMRTAFIAAEAARHLPRNCCVINVSPLLRELILRAASLPLSYDEKGPEGRIMQLITDEIRVFRELPLHLPMPSDARLTTICSGISRNPQRNESLGAWARKVGTSRRTVARLFIQETGMTFSEWRQQARLHAALTRLAAGQSIKRVAYASGYSSHSAFTHMFKRTFGTTPSRYFYMSDC